MVPSKAWGLDYESWEFPGSGAGKVAQLLRIGTARPSRVDIAWDFEVAPDYMACDAAKVIREHVLASSFEPGISGQGKVYTHYVGSPTSELRLRIYRRDLRDPALLEVLGPVLRFELVMRDARAREWWTVFRQDEVAAFEAAAAHWYRMTGRVIQDRTWAAPPLREATEEADAAQMLFQFVKQNASMLVACEEAGVDLSSLAKGNLKLAARETVWRQEKKAEMLQRVGAQRLEELVGELLVEWRSTSRTG